LLKYQIPQLYDLILFNHNGFTANTKDWIIIYEQKLSAKNEALLLERKIKKRGAKRFLNDIASR
jgi:putative endonuclease